MNKIIKSRIEEIELASFEKRSKMRGFNNSDEFFKYLEERGKTRIKLINTFSSEVSDIFNQEIIQNDQFYGKDVHSFIKGCKDFKNDIKLEAIKLLVRLFIVKGQPSIYVAKGLLLAAKIFNVKKFLPPASINSKLIHEVLVRAPIMLSWDMVFSSEVRVINYPPKLPVVRLYFYMFDVLSTLLNFSITRVLAKDSNDTGNNRRIGLKYTSPKKIASDYKLLVEFLMAEFSQKKQSAAIPLYSSMEVSHISLVKDLIDDIKLFLTMHEYVHIMIGHWIEDDDIEHELEADHLAAMALFYKYEKSGLGKCLVALRWFFNILEVADQCLSFYNSNTHPPLSKRLELIERTAVIFHNLNEKEKELNIFSHMSPILELVWKDLQNDNANAGLEETITNEDNEDNEDNEEIMESRIVDQLTMDNDTIAVVIKFPCCEENIGFVISGVKEFQEKLRTQSCYLNCPECGTETMVKQ
jgi:uncharacterized membrane protein